MARLTSKYSWDVPLAWRTLAFSLPVVLEPVKIVQMCFFLSDANVIWY